MKPSGSLVGRYESAFDEFALGVLDIGTSISPSRILLVLLFFLPFLDFTGDEPIDLAKHILFRTLAVGLLTYSIVVVAIKGGRRFPALSLGLPLTAYAATAFLSVASAVLNSRIAGNRAFLALATLPMLISFLYVTPYWVNTRQMVLKGVRVLLLSVLTAGLIGLAEIALHFLLPAQIPIRVSSVFHDPNIFSRFLATGIFFAGALLLFNVHDVFPRKALWLILSVSFVCLFFTLSRSGTGTVLVGVVLLALLAKRRKLALFLALLVPILGMLALAFLIYARQFGNNAFIEPSNINRIQLIIAGLDMIRQHWLLGIGYTNYSYVFVQSYFNSTMAVSLVNYEMLGYQTSIHNWLIEVWAEQGIFGVVGFVWFFGSLFRRLRAARARSVDKTLQAILAGYTLMFFAFLFHGFFYHTFISQFFFWVNAGFATAAITAANRENS
ncbi:MAG TPA: O-antigen ligase family protein [Bacteroidota bacterium]|nr:O-antigen ligase family protein [Bacteroidota bacterium]